MKKKPIAISLAGLGAYLALLACESSGARASVVAAAAASDTLDARCSVAGTWATQPDPDQVAGVDAVPWICTGAAQSQSGGTIVCDVPRWPNPTFAVRGSDPPLVLFPQVVRVTPMYGTWKRTGGNTFAFTQVAWALDADGDAVYMIRNSGRTTMAADCSHEKVESTMEFLTVSEPCSPEPGCVPTAPENIIPPAVVPPMFGYPVAIVPPPLPLD